MTKFCSDVKEKLGSLTETRDLKEKISDYNTSLTQVVNKHAPIISKTISVASHAPWFDTEYVNLRKLRRKAEKRFRKSGLMADKRVYQCLRKQSVQLAFDKKKQFVTSQLKQSSSKTLYALMNELIDNKKETVLPKCDSNKSLANQFQTFFREKIAKIRSTFTPSSTSATSSEINANLQILSRFRPTDADEITSIVRSFKIKCSPDDPIPANLLSSSAETFVPFWVELVNLSLETGSMEGLKNAVVIPLIKELNALTDTDNFKNYRPVSNLLYVSKLIERVVARRLQEQMIRNDLMIDKNYGYEKNHSTEHLLLKVVNDLYGSFDKNIPSVLVLLDLSAAFDTVDHGKLLDKLKCEIGIDCTALSWFKSFLIGRTQKFRISDEYLN